MKKRAGINKHCSGQQFFSIPVSVQFGNARHDCAYCIFDTPYPVLSVSAALALDFGEDDCLAAHNTTLCTGQLAAGKSRWKIRALPFSQYFFSWFCSCWKTRSCFYFLLSQSNIFLQDLHKFRPPVSSHINTSSISLFFFFPRYTAVGIVSVQNILSQPKNLPGFTQDKGRG